MCIKRKKSKDNREFRTKGVYMPQRKPQNPKIQRRRKGLFFTKSSKGIKRKKRIDSSKLKAGILIFFSILLVGALLFSLVFFVNRMRQGKKVQSSGDVIGMKDIPAYPGADFVFKNEIDEESVSNFLSSGNSAYRLPAQTDIAEVYEFYKEELPKLGWESVLSVPVGTEGMRSGEYWVKEGSAVRIFTKFNDVWYESISVEEAKTGLSERVKREIDRDLLLVDNEAEDLLPDFPWILKVPKEYVLSYTVAEFEDMRRFEIKRIGTNDVISFTPVAKYNREGLDFFLDKYIKLLNTQNSENSCGITTTKLAYTEHANALKGIMSCSDAKHEVAVMLNPNNGVVYILDSNREGDEYFETIFTTIKPQESRKLK
ncbi:MAG: hypothetical protein ACOX06_03565 [Candidatus Dojkabacteria bacterium]|jgi:hypothetical protein